MPRSIVHCTMTLGLSGVLLWGILLTSSVALGESPISENVGSSSRQFRHQTLQSIPFHQLNQAAKEKITDVLKNPSIYRRLPTTGIQADSDYFRFLVRYPEVIVNIWQLMGVTQMTTERTGPFTIKTNDGAGTTSDLELIYGNDTLHIYYGTGTYEGPVIRRKLTGKCVLVLRTQQNSGPQGKSRVNSQLDVFLKVDNATLGLIAKSIQPIVGRTADHNFVESVKFVQRLNNTTEKNGPGVQNMATRLKIDEDVRQKFVEIAGDLYERSAADIVSSQIPPDNLGHSHYTPLQAIPATLPQRHPSSLSIPTSYRHDSQGAERKWPRTGWYHLPAVIEAAQVPDSHSLETGTSGNSPAGWHVAARPQGYQAPQYR